MVPTSSYLRRTERQLRALIGQGLEVHLRALEPVDYADFCVAHGLAPEQSAARVAYAADPGLAGDPFVYGGEGLVELLPDLVDDHLARVRISVAYQALLVGITGDRAASGGWQGRLTAVLEHVTAVYRALAEGLGDGCHQLQLRVAAVGEQEELATGAELCVEQGRLFIPAREAEAFCVTLAAGLAGAGSGELLVHSTRSQRDRPARASRGRARTVRGWALAGGGLAPLDADGVRALLARRPGLTGPAGPTGPARVRPGFALPEPPPGEPPLSEPPLG